MMTADQLRQWRIGRRWTQRQAAEWFGVSTRSWRRYESPGEVRSHRRIPNTLVSRMKEYDRTTPPPTR